MHIKIKLQIFVLIIIFYFTKQVEVYAILMFFVFLHELGHLLAGILLKLKPKKLEINPFGLSITFEEFGVKDNKFEMKKIIIAMAGPAVNLLILIITYFVNYTTETKEIIIYSNLLIILFNLMPIYPLDGGRIVKGFLYILKGKESAEYITNVVANIGIILLTIFASIAIIYFKNIAIIFFILYLWILIIRENKRYALKERIKKVIKSNQILEKKQN